MAKTRIQKQSVTIELKSLFASAKSIAIVTFSKISVKADWEFRHAAKKQGVTYRVAKKTLLARAAKEAGMPMDFLQQAKGNIGFAVSQGDEVAPAKVLKDFMKRQKDAVVAFAGGYVRTGAQLDQLNSIQILALAALPGKQELLASVVRTAKNPFQRLVGAVSYPMRSLVQALGAIRDKAN